MIGRAKQRSLSTDRQQQLELLLRPCPVEQFLAQPLREKEPLVPGLLHRRDLVALGARRRHGKTTFLTQLAIDLATPAGDFLGYPIPAARRSLLLLLEDDPGELQSKIRQQTGGRDLGGRIDIMTRDDFYAHDVCIDAGNAEFQHVVWCRAESHKPDLIAFDNLAHIINAEYNEPSRVHSLMAFCYELASTFNAANILAAHPKKGDPQQRIDLLNDPEGFFEAIMGSSHFINSTGSLWGLQRLEDRGSTMFLGGRQRGSGHQQHAYVALDEDGRFRVVSEALTNLPLVQNTEPRRKAWSLLPEHPVAFSYTEAQRRVCPVAMRSRSTYAEWMEACRRLKVIVDTPDGRLCKAEGLTRIP